MGMGVCWSVLRLCCFFLLFTFQFVRHHPNKKDKSSADKICVGIINSFVVNYLLIGYAAHNIIK